VQEKILDKFRFEVARNGIIHIGEQTEQSGIRWLGTGFVVDDACTFATAKHVLAGANREKIVVRFQLPQDKGRVKTIQARVLHEESETDIAFLKIDRINNAVCKSGSLHIFKLYEGVSAEMFAGEPISIIGHPVLSQTLSVDTPVLRKGHLSSGEIFMGTTQVLLLDFIGVPGFSGSPVILDKSGDVIGVVYGPGPTPRGFGFEWATPITRHNYETAIVKTKE
jgi:S1-C subfamily serine protease